MADKRRRGDGEGDAGEDGSAGDGAWKITSLQAQNRALATNMYGYKRRIAELEHLAGDLSRKNAGMYSLLSGLQGGLLQVRRARYRFFSRCRRRDAHARVAPFKLK